MTIKSKEDEIQNCWDFLKCPGEIRQKCEAYRRNLGAECWFVMEDVTKGCYSKEKYGGCNNCPWYKKLNPSLLHKAEYF